MKTNIEIQEYSPKALLIVGEGTREIKDSLKDFCIWNKYLKGWITKPENRVLVEGLINDTPVSVKANKKQSILSFLQENVNRFDKAVVAAIGLKSLVVDDPKWFPNSKKAFGFTGFGCGFASFVYDKRSKKTATLISEFSKVQRTFTDWYINSKVSKTAKAELKKFGTPIEAVIAQDIKINSTLLSIASDWINANGGKIQSISSRYD